MRINRARLISTLSLASVASATVTQWSNKSISAVDNSNPESLSFEEYLRYVGTSLAIVGSIIGTAGCILGCLYCFTSRSMEQYCSSDQERIEELEMRGQRV